MAGLRKNFFGIPYGKLGPFVFKVRDGKPYISTEPFPRETPYSEEELERQSKFAFLGKLGAVLQEDNRIKSAWQQAEVKGKYVCNKITHINFRLLNVPRDISQLKLMPLEKVFPVQVKHFEITGDTLAVTFEPFAIPFEIDSCPVISAHGVVYISGKILPDGIEPDYFFQHTMSEPQLYRKGEEHTFLIPSLPGDMKRWNSRQFCFTLILESKQGAAEACSENVVI